MATHQGHTAVPPGAGTAAQELGLQLLGGLGGLHPQPQLTALLRGAHNILAAPLLISIQQ